MGETEGIAGTADAVPGNGGPRSAATRQAILDAARSAFASHGYDRTTIRAVAAAAGVDASMVMRYFGSKAGLFTAASTADLKAPDLSLVPESERGEALVRHLISRWEDATSGDKLMLLLRTATTSDDVAERLQTVLERMIAGALTAVGTADAEQRAAFIQTQILGLALCRYVLRLEPLASMPVARVIAGVAPAIQHYLEGSEVVGGA